MANELVRVPFHGDVIEATQDDAGVWVSLRRACESLGIALHRQTQKLQEKPWANVNMKLMMDQSGREFEMACLHLDSFPMWLATIEPSRVKEAVRPKLELYQKEAARALADHFLGRPRQGVEDVRALAGAIALQVAETVAAQVRGVLEESRPALPEPRYSIKDRMEALGWRSATPKQRNQVRTLALAKLNRRGFGYPGREGLSPGGELLFPESQCHVLDEAIVSVWEEAKYREEGGMFAGA